MDTSFFGIGLPELIFIAIIALIVLGPERLPGTMREIAKMWGYVRNLSRELTAQFGDEFKVLEDMNPQKMVREMLESAEKEAKEQMDSLKSVATTKSTTTVTTAVASTETPAGTAQTVTTTEVTVSATKIETTIIPESSTETPPSTIDNVVDANTIDSVATPVVEVQKEPENRILPPTTEHTNGVTAESQAEEPVIEGHLVQNVAAVSLNGVVDKPENGV
jgi:sec-independent protein translocase protein TatB